MEIEMTDATFQPRMTNSQIAKTETSTQIAVSFIRFLLSNLSAERSVDADSHLAAQARREAARRSVDNLLW